MADFVLNVRDVTDLARTVDDQEQVAAMGHITVGKHQVIDDAARVIQQQAIALFTDSQAHHIHGDQAFQRGCGVCANQAQLTHVRHIKKAGGAACVQVLGHQPGRVLHRHVVAGKRHHAGTEFSVQGVQRGVQKGGRSGRRHRRFSRGERH